MKALAGFYGDDRVTVCLPDRTRVVGAPPPLPPLIDYEGAVRKALRSPLGCPPLGDLLRPGSRVTVAFDDPCIPLPPMRLDVRARAVGVVLEELYRIGIERDRVRLVCANGLHRKWTHGELRHLLGRRLWREMGPGRVQNHDAEDPGAVTELGKSESGHPVEVNRLVRDSDLVLYVNVNWTSMNGGWKSVLVGLGTYRSIRCHHNAHVLGQGTLMDPERSHYHRIMGEMGAVLSGNANVFTVETVINNRVWGPFTGRLVGARGTDARSEAPLPMRIASMLPEPAKRRLSASLRSSYQPVAVHAGRVDQVHPKTLEIVSRQQDVTVQGQSDALVTALPNLSPYSVFSRINPILAMNMALGYVYNLHRRRPVVRAGGVMIVQNPFQPGFHPRHHPSYEAFYREVLPETKAPAEIEERFEERFATDPEYVRRYRYEHAYHGVHPLYAWGWGCIALEQLSRVIVVGAADPAVVAHLGFTAVPTMERALDLAAELLGQRFSLTYLRMPPLFCADVT